MVQNHHDGGLVGTGVNFQIPADADEAGAVIALVLHGAAQTVQSVQLGAGAAGQGGNVLSAGLGDHLGGEGSVVHGNDIHAGKTMEEVATLVDGLLVGVDLLDIGEVGAGINQKIVVDFQPEGADDGEVMLDHQVVHLVHGTGGGILDGQNAVLAQPLIDGTEHGLKGLEVHNKGIFKNLLTGFKYIGELITELEKQGKASDFVMGFEESYGYLAGTHARDKDAVVASMLICEMAAYYKSRGKTLIDGMNGLYDEFGYYCNTVQSYTFEGAAGMEKMAAIMDGLRDNKPSSFAGYEVTKIDDYKTSKSTIVKTGEESEITLPKSNVLAYTLTNGNKVIVRPSGTEPKIKAYITAIGQSEENAKEIAQRLLDDANELMK